MLHIMYALKNYNYNSSSVITENDPILIDQMREMLLFVYCRMAHKTNLKTLNWLLQTEQERSEEESSTMMS